MSKLSERELIDYIRRAERPGADVIKGIGDDCAVLKYTRDEYLLFTTDMMVEGTHFTRAIPPEAIGRKALAVNISDIAGCGGRPRYGLISVGFPKTTTLDFAAKIYQGVRKLAREFSISIIGGDTVRSNKLVINIVLLGTVAKGGLITRDGARPGDMIFVTGKLGRAHKDRHYNFKPRLKEARKIKHLFNPSAMIDLSDGLASDLAQIIRESKCGAIIYESLIPVNRAGSLKNALYDGEDFELLFTARIKPGLKPAQPKLAQPIGEITTGREIVLVDRKGRKKRVDPRITWQHF